VRAVDLGDFVCLGVVEGLDIVFDVFRLVNEMLHLD